MAFQSVTPIRLAQAVITESYLAIYTRPTNARTYVKDMLVCNTQPGAVTVFINIVPDQAVVGEANAIYNSYAIAANTTFHWKGTQVLSQGDTIQVKGTAPTATFVSTATDNCFTTNTTGGTESNVLVTIANHNASDGDSVTFSGAVAVGGITAPQLNTTLTVTSATTNTFIVVTAGTATSVATGGGTGITAVFDYGEGPIITISGGEAT